MEENSLKHKVYLAIDSFKPDVSIVRKDYYPADLPREYYHYNEACMNMSMSNSDRRAYPRLYEAVKSFTDSDSRQPTLDIVFNQPDESWERPPSNGNVSDGRVRIRVEARGLLKQINSVCGYNLNVCIRGYVSRSTLHRGRHFPLNGRGDKELKFPVRSDGTTKEKVINMIPGLFGLFQLNAVLTVSLEWQGPGPYLDGRIVMSRTLNPNFEIIAGNEESYNCHSELLSEVSPVFQAMLNSSFKECESKRIRIEDFDGNVIGAFLDFAYDRSIESAFRSAGDCLQLFSFANKYHIPELENATRLLLLNKDKDWFSTETALDLYYLSFNLEDNLLVKRALSIIRNRKEALYQLEEFQELPADVKAIFMN